MARGFETNQRGFETTTVILDGNKPLTCMRSNTFGENVLKELENIIPVPIHSEDGVQSK